MSWLKGCNLITLLESLQIHFSLEPPVYTKPKDGPSAPQSLSTDRDHADVPPPLPSRVSIAHPSSGSQPDRPMVPSKPPSMILSGPLLNPVCLANNFPIQILMCHHSSIVSRLFSFAAVCPTYTASLSTVGESYKYPLSKKISRQPCPSANGTKYLPLTTCSAYSSTDPASCTATSSSATSSPTLAIPRYPGSY